MKFELLKNTALERIVVGEDWMLYILEKSTAVFKQFAPPW